MSGLVTTGRASNRHTTTTSLAAALRRLADCLDTTAETITETGLDVALIVNGCEDTVDELCRLVGTTAELVETETGHRLYSSGYESWDGIELAIFS